MSASNAPASEARTEKRPLPGLVIHPIAYAAAAILLGAAVFAFDLSMPLGVAGGVPYVALVLLAPLFRRLWCIPALGAVATALTVSGYFLSPQGGELWMVLTNRGLALLVIWVTAYVVYQWAGKGEKLRNNEEAFRDLYDNAPDMYMSLDPATRCIIECNQTFAANIGFAKQEIIGRPIGDFYHQDSQEEAGRCFQDFATHGTAESDNLRLKRKDGSTMEVSLRVSAIRDGDGKIIRSRSVLRDITELKEAERDAAQNAVLLETTFKTIDQGFCVYDADEILVAYNQSYQEILDFPPGFLRLGLTHEQITRCRAAAGHFGDADVEELVRERTGPADQEFELTHERTLPNGMSYLLQRKPMPNGGFVNVFTNITKLKEAERDAAAKTAYLEAIFTAGGVAFTIKDADFNLIQYNEAYETLFGFPKGSLHIGMSLADMTRLRHRLGHFGDRDVEELIGVRTKLAANARLGEKTLPDGTCYVFHRRTLPDGSFVTSYIDIPSFT
ncbi:MAG: PAS-domain containing protein, partial [Proteobacteria bacterium]|nr:PAS-domain containing protein [Pseudomonadota bacterium]